MIVLTSDFRMYLKNILVNMTRDDYIRLVQAMDMDYADKVKSMDKFDIEFVGYSASEMYEIFKNSNDSFYLDDDYFIHDSFNAVVYSFDDPMDFFDTDDVQETIVTTMNSYGNYAIQTLIDKFKRITSDDAVKMIQDALKDESNPYVGIQIGSQKFDIFR